MATKRPPREADPDAPAPDPATTPNAVGAGHDPNSVWRQLADIKESLGTIIAHQTTAEDRLKGLESKVSGLNRIVWIGVGIFALAAFLISIGQPLVRFLLHSGLVSP